MIRAGRASLVVSSVETDPDLVSHHLGLSPTTVSRKGEVSRSGRVCQHHTWAVDAGPLSNDEDDQTGTAALTTLLERCRAAFGRVGTLPADCHARIVWSADSDSAQGGFVLTAAVAAQIAALGVDLYGTMYLGDGAERDQ
ncbi:DUF4279 domain-containing protein [Microbacterium hominis]|uniref:DUF4279 domain-containing protein n=1 Tax=Microbacterium hominis TaxID=162426 RepID=A0A0B4D5L8_9MICO|nr:DUF4279 domain-containing protein [Microbacterium hominis]KIC59480.1 hypothetical protein RM52_03210 [Microbacterium hominis]